MKTDLSKADFDAFLASYDRPAEKALRVNSLKGTVEMLEEASGFDLTRVPFECDGYYYDDELIQPGRHVLHEAGAYYIQEPSAMLPAALLGAKPGEVILDLCAAPGGKTTQIASAMNGRGLLVANEIHPSRVKILSENVERCGVRNCMVVSESPDRLADRFPSFFDRILVDAPCSGEGMFRKNPEAALEWSIENVALCAERQDMILSAASKMLRPGGTIVYSTCTFSREEDEEAVDRFLHRFPDFELIHQQKLLPHLIRGEGQYAAVLRCEGTMPETDRPELRPPFVAGKKTAALSVPDELYSLLSSELDPSRLLLFGEQLYYLPEYAFPINGLKVLRPGLHLGACKKNRFEPAHALALSLRPEEATRCISLEIKEAASYIAGNQISLDTENGWVLLTTRGYSIGFGKASGGVIKNHYPKGLRKTL